MQPDLILRGANLPDGRQGHDILITDGLIQAVGEQIDARGRHELDVSGRLVTPPFVDCHFHMDATLSLGLPRLNRSGTLLEGIQLWNELKQQLTVEAVIEQGAGLLRHGRGPGHRRHPQPCRRLRRPPDRRRGAARGQAAGRTLPHAAARGLPPGRPLPLARCAREPGPGAGHGRRHRRRHPAFRADHERRAALGGRAVRARGRPRPDGRPALRRDRRPPFPAHRDAGDARPCGSGSAVGSRART